MQDTHEKFMEEAIRLAATNLYSGHGGPFGCIIVKDGTIIASAFNEVLSSHDPTAHAEILAIRRACELLGSYQLDGCDIYTSCEPCPMCLGAIYWSRPRKVYYAASRHDAHQAGFDDDHIYRQISVPHPERDIPFEQIGREKVSLVFSEWSQNNHNSIY